MHMMANLKNLENNFFLQLNNLLLYPTVSKNYIWFENYSWFFEVVLYKMFAKPILAKKSKQSNSCMIYEVMELN